MADSTAGRKYPPILVATLIVLAVLCVVNLVVSLSGANFRGGEDEEGVVLPRIAFITGGVDPFWDVAVAGARSAADRYSSELLVHIPSEGEASQNEILRKVISENVDGVVISPLHAENQTQLLNQIAAATNLITFDSDAPNSKRLCYVGTNNYAAGWLCAETVRKAMPNGGRVLISIGSLEKDNGRKRRQGLIDELLDRDYEPNRDTDPTDGALKGSMFTIAATLQDNNDASQAKANVISALQQDDKIDCIIGLFGYSGPSILAGLQEAGKVGEVKIFGFDDHDATLGGIRNGSIEATIIQDTYQFGFASVQALATLARKDGILPISGEMLFPCFAVRQDNLDQFVAERNAQSNGVGG